ncbi:MAG: hypothetical protein WC523_00785 [Patescibacteria group bacterium]
MNNAGIFIEKHFKNKEIEFHCRDESEYIYYSDSMVLNRNIIKGIVLEYDKESGVLTLDNKGKIFYVNEESIELFWEPGLNINDIMRPALNTGNKIFNK